MLLNVWNQRFLKLAWWSRGAASRRPSGLTLLEVLIAVFVLLFGLLGVLALIPVAMLRMNQALQADRASAVAECALEEVKTRGMLDASTWRGFGNTAYSSAEHAFVIDPYFFALHSSDPAVQRFPSDGTNSGDSLQRLTLWDSTQAAPISGEVASRTFVTHDDLLFGTPDDPQKRPYAAFLTDTGISTTFASNAAVLDTSPRTYSWLATVTPTFLPSVQPLPNQRIFSVSVVVFFNRDLTVAGSAQRDLEHPGERTAGARFLGTGLGGADVRLYLGKTGSPPPLKTYLDVTPGHWLMINGNNVCHWYRVVAVGDISEESVDANGNVVPSGGVASWTRVVTLTGPDWPALAAGFNPAHAAVFTDVVDVHTETIDLK